MDIRTTLKNIPIKDIHVGERFRQDYGKSDEWEDFKRDIAENGLISAIAVKQLSDGYELLAGGRRLRACMELGHETINATIYTGDIDDADMLVIELNENLKRKNLSPREEAEGKRRLLQLLQEKYGEKTSTRPGAPGVSMRDAAAMIGESVANFSRDVQLAEAYDIMPEIEHAKSKAEAYRLAKKNIQKLREFKAAREFTAKAKAMSEEDPRKLAAGWYHVGDFFEGIKEVAGGIVDLIEIDPPYGIDLHDKKKGDVMVTDDYAEVPAEEYESFMRKTLSEAYRVAKPNAWLILWVGIEPWFEKMFQWATEAGWEGRRIPGIWVKTIGQVKNPAVHLASSAEFFFYMRKGSPVIRNQGRTNIFQFKPVPPTKKIHPTERPIEMMQDIIETFVGPGAIILSPFLGSGNTLLAAYNAKCTAWGYDLSQASKNAFVTRLAEHDGGDFHSY